MNIIKLPLLFVIFLVHCQSPNVISSLAETGPIGNEAMISTTHPLATEVGLGILQKGGNAIDAAIAVQFSLSVVYPQAGNIGGGGFAVIRLDDGTVATLDFREKAPQSATKDMYLDADGNVIKELSKIGHLASGVPGSVAGMWELHQKYGQLPWADLVSPAVNLAANGHQLTEFTAKSLNNKQRDFIKVNSYQPWVVKEEDWNKGDTIYQKDLATTLSLIENKGRDGFYKGIVADLIATEMQSGGGLITQKDLIAYEPIWRAALKGTYKGFTIHVMAPPSSGGIALLQLLQGAEKYDFKKLGHNSAQMIHIKTELERRVYADRATFLGDADFYPVPVDQLLDPNYNKERFSSILEKKATLSTEIKEGTVNVIESIETTHFSIVDKAGNSIGITTTLNGNFGSAVMVKDGGFFLNNEMDDFSVKPGTPNMFGLIGGKANAIAPEKRMLSSMTPTIVEKDGKLFLVTVSPGGSTIITTVFQNIINVIDFEMTLHDAINAKRAHSQWLPDVILIEENAISEEAITTLEQMGHQLKFMPEIGKINAILVRPDGTLEGGPDYLRSDSYAIGY